MTNIAILTGFLGSGKTTTLTSILKSVPKGIKVAVIINEFAAVGIDGKIINQQGMEVKELANGCVCCTKSKELEQTIEFLKEKHKPDTILLETTGLATLLPLIRICNAHRLGITGIITVIDAYKASKTQAFGKATAQQIKNSNKIIINKTDMISRQELDKIILLVRNLNGSARIISTSMGKVSFGDIHEPNPMLLSLPGPKETLSKKLGALISPRLGLDEISRHISESGIGSVSFVTSSEIDQRRFYDFVDQISGKAIRAKGIIKFNDAKTKTFNYASGLINIEDCSPAERTSIVVIAKMGIFEKARILLVMNSLKNGKTAFTEHLENLKNFLKSA